jgi:hypothetical protein
MAKVPNQTPLPGPDIATRIMERMVHMPPKHHKDMKLGTRKPKAGESSNPRPKKEKK